MVVIVGVVVQLGLRFAARVREIPGSNPGDPTSCGCGCLWRFSVVAIRWWLGIRGSDVLVVVFFLRFNCVVSGSYLQGIPAVFRMLWGPFGGLRVFAFVLS